MLEALGPWQLAYCVGVLFAAYFVRGIAGFGSALVAVPLLAVVLPVAAVVPLIVLLDQLGSLSHGAGNFRHIRWRELLPLLPFTAAGVGIALYLLTSVEPGLLTSALGAFVILYAAYSLMPLPPLRGGRIWAAPLGLLGGTVGTVFGTGGPFTVIYLTLRELDKPAFRGTIATVFILDGGMRLLGFAASGLYNRDNLLIAAAAVPILALGMYAGGHVHTSLSRRAFVRIIAIVLLGSGTALLFK